MPAVPAGFRLQNLGRRRWVFTCLDGEIVVLGDSKDADGSETLPPQGRHPKLQPNPVLELPMPRWENLGPENQRIINEMVGKGQIAKTPLREAA